MKIKPFTLERFFAKYKFTAPYLLCCSDCEALSMHELLGIADEESQQLWSNLKLGYGSAAGHPILRQEIAKLYKTIGPEEVLVLNPEEGIFIAMNVLLEPGDHVVTAFPGYQSLYEIANMLSCKVDFWLPRYEGGWHFDVQQLESLLTEKTKMLVVNFPHNPTGATLLEKDWLQLVEIAKAKDIFLFSDEMYHFLEYDPQTQNTAACDLYENGISLFGLSKSFALPGLRIGWLATKNQHVLAQITTFKDYTTNCSSAPSEVLAIMALRAKEIIFKRNLNIIKKNLSILDVFFSDHNHIFDWQAPTAGPIAFPRLKTEKKVSEFCTDLVAQKGVLLLPSNIYDFDSNHFRIGFARKNMPVALEHLEEYLMERGI